MPAMAPALKPDFPVLVLRLEQELEVELKGTGSAGTEPGTI
jgi:hypothetical protein